jgi:hypothetical protein
MGPLAFAAGAVLAEFIRPTADPSLSGLRVFGGGASPDPCKAVGRLQMRRWPRRWWPPFATCLPAPARAGWW